MLILGEFKGETYPNKSLENFPEFCKRWKFSMAIKPDAAKAEPQSILHISDGEFTERKKYLKISTKIIFFQMYVIFSLK